MSLKDLKPSKQSVAHTISSFPAFTLAALALLVLKFTAYPSISWTLIILVWAFPIIFLFSIMGVILVIAGIVAFIALLYWLIFVSWRA
jgi:hypothetical protein